MMKKKQVPRNNIAFFTLIITILLGFVIFLSINRITESEAVPTLQVTIEPSPTFELFAGEEVVYVVENMSNYYEGDFRFFLGIGEIVERERFDDLGISQTALTMTLTLGEDNLIAYEEFEWDYFQYHIRVLDIDPQGFAVLAISENQ